MTMLTPEEATPLLWAIWDLPQAKRLKALQRVAREAWITRSDDWNRETVRLGPIRSIKPDNCFTCGTRDRKLYWHHIITLDHGGDNQPYNVVGICHECHRGIHPWLAKGTSYEQREGPYLLVDRLKALITRAKWGKKK